jgi:multicomponent Na+:H+ antiporter subunit B
LLLSTALAVVFIRHLFAVAMLFGIYSLLSAGFFLNLSAPDVALTEAAIGAGIAPMLMLAALSLTRHTHQPDEKKSQRNKWLPLGVVIMTGAALVYATLDMPYFGDASAPAHNHVAPRYIEQTYNEIGIPNMVAAILASYRGFDTLGEVIVIFTAGMGVLALLGISTVGRGRPYGQRTPLVSLRQHVVLRVISKILIPIIMIYGLYIQFHGEYGPGGGFQAGVIFASALILYVLIFGLDAGLDVFSMRFLKRAMVFGALLFGGVGILTLALGGNYLDYNALADNPVDGQHLGILLIELGVGVCVAAVMLVIFYNFTGRHLLLDEEDQQP